MAKAAALFVGPVHQFERRLGDDAEVVQRMHDLEPGQDAESAVELPAGRLAVEMAAEQHRQAARIAPRAAGEHVADCIDPYGQPGGLTLRAEPVATVPVHVRQRQPTNAALRRCADLRHGHQAVPQPLAINALVGLGGHTGCPWMAPPHLARRAACCKRVRDGTGVGMRATWILAAGLALAGCKLIDQTTFAPSPEATPA